MAQYGEGRSTRLESMQPRSAAPAEDSPRRDHGRVRRDDSRPGKHRSLRGWRRGAALPTLQLMLDALLQLIGNISTALILVLCYFNFLLFENYLRLIVWAFLVSQALRQAKTNIVSILEYLSDDPDVDRYVRPRELADR